MRKFMKEIQDDRLKHRYDDMNCVCCGTDKDVWYIYYTKERSDWSTARYQFNLMKFCYCCYICNFDNPTYGCVSILGKNGVTCVIDRMSESCSQDHIVYKNWHEIK
jgi:hypothetical protein